MSAPAVPSRSRLGAFPQNDRRILQEKFRVSEGRAARSAPTELPKD